MGAARQLTWIVVFTTIIGLVVSRFFGLPDWAIVTAAVATSVLSGAFARKTSARGASYAFLAVVVLLSAAVFLVVVYLGRRVGFSWHAV